MKRFFSLLVVAALAATMLTGCGGTASSGSTDASVKTGYAVLSSIASSTDATADKAGLAQVDSTVVAVTVDADGKVVKCVIDAVQPKINFDASGKVTTPLDTAFKTKNEQGAAYNMKSKSGIGKEWNEQAAAFAAYCVGKTSDEIGKIAVNEQGVPTGSDLTSSVTIHVGDFIKLVQKAIANAQDLGAKASDKLGLGVVTSISDSKGATADAEGQAQGYSTYAVVTVDSSNKITSCIIDASQSNVKFDATGKITTDLTAELKTKNELGAAYNMKSKSSIGKEWNEQAAAFAKYTVGKTIDEVSGVAVNAEGVPTASDLTSSVTIHIGDFINALKAAVSSSK